MKYEDLSEGEINLEITRRLGVDAQTQQWCADFYWMMVLVTIVRDRYGLVLSLENSHTNPKLWLAEFTLEHDMYWSNSWECEAVGAPMAVALAFLDATEKL